MRGSPAPNFGGDFDWQAYRARESEIEKLEFDRRELDHRTLRRLQAILRPEQVARMGGLPDPAASRKGPGR